MAVCTTMMRTLSCCSNSMPRTTPFSLPVRAAVVARLVLAKPTASRVPVPLMTPALRALGEKLRTRSVSVADTSWAVILSRTAGTATGRTSEAARASDERAPTIRPRRTASSAERRPCNGTSQAPRGSRDQKGSGPFGVPRPVGPS